MKQEEIDKIDEMIEEILSNIQPAEEREALRTAIRNLVGAVLESPLAGNRWFNTGYATPVTLKGKQV